MTPIAGMLAAGLLSACNMPTSTQTPQVSATITLTDPAPASGLPPQGSDGTIDAISPENVDRLNVLYSLPLPTDITRIAWSSDSKLLAAGTLNGIAIFETSTQTQVGTVASGTLSHQMGK